MGDDNKHKGLEVDSREIDKEGRFFVREFQQEPERFPINKSYIEEILRASNQQSPRAVEGVKSAKGRLADKRYPLRPALDEMSQLMESRLRDNDHKGGWGSCSWKYLHEGIRKNNRKLRDAMMRRDPEAIQHAIDLANYAMMIVDNLLDGRYSQAR